MILIDNLRHCKTLTEIYGLLSPDTAGAHRKAGAIPPHGAGCLNTVDYLRQRVVG